MSDSERPTLDFQDRLIYGQYLHIDELLSAQQPLSDAHDEMLFIVQHQTTELWFRLVLHEMQAVMDGIDRDELGPVFKGLARVERVVRVLVESWEVLSTMTPSDYLQFRASLGSSSGFQSHQYRLLEYSLGNKDPMYMLPFRHQPAVHRQLQAAFDAPSLYDRAIALLARRGLRIPEEVLRRDHTAPHQAHPEVVNAWRAVYTDTARYWDLYELAEKLLDVEDALRQWRFRHVTTVQRIIGGKPGTGGTSGVAYLRQRLDLVLFPELWTVRTEL